MLQLRGHPAVSMCADLLRRVGAVITNERMQAAPSDFDVVLFSSDQLPDDQRGVLAQVSGETIFCDIPTALPGQAVSPLCETALQARCGLMDVTGFSDGPPTASAVPLIDLSAALYAASVILAMRLAGKNDARVTVSLLGCGVSTLTTFLPRAFVGERARRIGNRHPACAPWNAYPTRDGNVLICTSSDEQWNRLCASVNRREFLEPRFASLEKRLADVDEVDLLMESWTRTLTSAECLRQCEAAGIPAGPIVSPAKLHEEPNFRFRHPEAAVAQQRGAAANDVAQKIGLVRTEPLTPGRESCSTLSIGGDLPLAGLRVLELGQFTAVPLATKHLAALGAEVIKIEPPSGEVARRWQPTRGGLSYYFAITNSGKVIEFVDLTTDDGRQRLGDLVGSVDVLIENMRPGALAKLGFDRTRLAVLNPDLVYCAVSGFGTHSAYPGRPAFDTVIQGMSGLMELTPCEGRPVKLGVSAADILGAQSVIYALLASLPQKGLFIDIAMQDIATWAAVGAECWTAAEGEVLSCLDGGLWIDNLSYQRPKADPAVKSLPRALAQQFLAQTGTKAHPIARIDELLLDPAICSEALALAEDEEGGLWPSLHLPYRIDGQPFAPPRIPQRCPGR